MPFDFPASPANGQQYGRYTYDGEKWVGGLQTQGVSNAEQFFDLAGRNSIDIVVPSWAKGANIEGSIYPGAASSPICMRVSVDGTTFLSGSTDYSLGGPFHNNTGAGSYLTQSNISQGFANLTWGVDNLGIPHNFTTVMNLVAGSQTIWIRSECCHYTNSGATRWEVIATYLNASVPQVKALRIYSGAGNNWPTNSWVRIKWLGDLAQQPNGVSIIDAPSDGNEYVRVNGVWRLKNQTFDVSGKTNHEILVPVGAKLMRSEMVLWTTTNVANTAMGWQGSVDGTSYITGASDYYYTGMIHYSGSSGYGNLPGASANYGALSFASDYTFYQAVRLRSLWTIQRPPAQQSFSCFTNGSWYNSPATNSYTESQHTSWMQYTNLGTNALLKKIKIMNATTAAVWGPVAWINVDWIY